MAIKFHKDPEPPALDNLHLWFDAADVATLWQDDGRSTPVTASGDPIGAIDNKGLDELVALTQSNATLRMIYDTSKASDTGGAPVPMLVSICAVSAADHVAGIPASDFGEAANEQTICMVMEVDTLAAAGRGWLLSNSPRIDFNTQQDTLPSSVVVQNGGGVISSARLPGSTLVALYHRSNTSTMIAAKFSWDSGDGEVIVMNMPNVTGNIVASAAPADYFQLRGPFDDAYYVWFQASNGGGSIATDPGGSGTGVVVTNVVAGMLAANFGSNVASAVNALDQFTASTDGVNIVIRNNHGPVTLFASTGAAASVVSGSIETARAAANGEIGAPHGFQLGFPAAGQTLFWGARTATIGIDGAVGELLFWNKNLDPSETDLLETYITKKWGITWLTNALPAPENIVHRFDFSDTSTLWRDAAGTLPVTASGDAILRVDNKGFDGTALLQSNGSSLAPIWTNDTGAINGLGVGDFSLSTVRVSAIIADSQGADLGDYTCLFVAVTDNFSGADIGFGWGSTFSELGTRFFAETAFHALVNGVTFNACTASVPASGVVYAVMMDNDGNDNQEVRYSFDAGASTGTATSGGPQDGTVFAVGTDPTGANGHDGRIAELIVWTPSLTSAERDALEVYVTDRWGIAWS